VLVSLPEFFSVKELFTQTNTTDKYVFKGMICKKISGNHHVAFFRRIVMKVDLIDC
jgi:hypothetical protein